MQRIATRTVPNGCNFLGIRLMATEQMLAQRGTSLFSLNEALG